MSATMAGVTVLWGPARPAAGQRGAGDARPKCYSDPDELEGFCAALTDLDATADEYGDFSHMFSELADKQLSAA